MAKESVFYSFHYKNDVFRVQQVRQMGVIEGDEPVKANEWEQVKAKGDDKVKEWIDNNMKGKRCVVVLIGSETSTRPLVKYEIKRAWEMKKGLFGIYIHNLNCPQNGTSSRGDNPFDSWNIDGKPMSKYVKTYDPWWIDPYGDIKGKLAGWVDSAIAQAKAR